MFAKGQEVVCVDAVFPAWVHQIYTALPVDGQTYTIREVELGRENPVTLKGQEAEGTIRVLLKELTNPTDPRHADGHELGFKGERFVPLEELPPEENTEKEPELVLLGHKGEGFPGEMYLP